MTFPTKVIVQNEARQRLQLEERLFQNIEGTDAKQLYLCVSESQTFSPINHHMKRFFGFDALRLNICQKAFCERIMLLLTGVLISKNMALPQLWAKSLCKMRQDSTFVLIYLRVDKLFALRKIKTKTWKVPKTDICTCKSTNILQYSVSLHFY